MARPEKIRLGDLLIQQKLITEDQLNDALEQQKSIKLKLGRILVEMGFVTEENISATLAKQLSLPFVDIRKFAIKPEVVRLISESDARRLHAIVLENSNDGFLVGMTDPTDQKAVQEMGKLLQQQPNVAVITEGQLLEGIDRGYWRTQETTGMS